MKAMASGILLSRDELELFDIALVDAQEHVESVIRGEIPPVGARKAKDLLILQGLRRRLRAYQRTARAVVRVQRRKAARA